MHWGHQGAISNHLLRNVYNLLAYDTSVGLMIGLHTIAANSLEIISAHTNYMSLLLSTEDSNVQYEIAHTIILAYFYLLKIAISVVLFKQSKIWYKIVHVRTIVLNEKIEGTIKKGLNI